MIDAYNSEVINFLSKDICGEEREKTLKSIYLEYYSNPYNFVMHIQSLQNILKSICKLSNNIYKYEEILEELIDAINSVELGLEKYKSLTTLEIQYAFIILNIKNL